MSRAAGPQPRTGSQRFSGRVAKVAELADALALGASGLSPWGFESPLSHHRNTHPRERVPPQLGYDKMSEQTSNQVEHSQDGVRHTLRIVVPAADMSERVDAATQAYRSRAKLPGFRPGKAPLSMVRQQFGADIRKHVLDHMLPEVLSTRNSMPRELRPLDSPELARRAVRARLGSRLHRGVRYGTRGGGHPHRPQGQPSRPAVAVTDEMVDEAMEQLRERGGRLVPGGRCAQPRWRCSAAANSSSCRKTARARSWPRKTASSGSATNRQIPSLNEELVGHARGRVHRVLDHDTRRAIPERDPGRQGSPLPGEAHRAEAAHACRSSTTSLPRISARRTSLAVLRARVSRRPRSQHGEQRRPRRCRHQLLQSLRDGNPVDVPDSLIERRLDEMTRRFANDLAQQGIDPRNALDWQAFRKEQRGPAADSDGRGDAARQVRRRPGNRGR